MLVMSGMAAVAALAFSAGPAAAASATPANPAPKADKATTQAADRFGPFRSWTVGIYRSPIQCNRIGQFGERRGQWDDYTCVRVPFGPRRGWFALQARNYGPGFPGHGPGFPGGPGGWGPGGWGPGFPGGPGHPGPFHPGPFHPGPFHPAKK
ncbi:hypothetical protein Adu01nite_40570 [Paractinoplanes durhamensis]|uniref:Uncharacterized protein n=2 Tax=Paractinoplanes durhamensis TaxID=113563 RepID=A0ABQ3YYR7_9ACTN|nr:hypothetical protein Adu01nite_40570 [Actinoplanes durhamensis]